MWMLRSSQFWIGCVINSAILGVIGDVLFDFDALGFIVYSIAVGLVYGISYDIMDAWHHPFHRRQR